jgi:predicted RNA binding protein YcfA (HicA-like mRNA interferase family)
MSQIEKLLKKFTQAPQNARYADIEKILLHLGFEKISTKGSHVKWKHQKMRHDIIIPIHSGECKDFYKKQISTNIQNLINK